MYNTHKEALMVLSLDKYRSALAQEMRAMFEREAPYPPVLQMGLYHLGLLDQAGRPGPGLSGKMLRPALCLALCEGLGGDLRDGLPAALALELAHRSSLVFDDIQYRGLERNGRPSVWNIWGPDQALNAGLALTCYARLALHRLEPEPALRVQEILERAVVDLCQGQYLDLGQGLTCPSVGEYQEMVRLKTGVLVGAACEAGAVTAGQGPEVVARAREFGEQLGLAFQMRDDYLGVWGDPAVMGKEAGDLAARKRGLPLVLAMARSERARELALEPPEDRKATMELTTLVAFDRELQISCKGYAKRAARRALARLQNLALADNCRDELTVLAHFAANRMA
jgi:geranylgeranyl diphosphate synthase, type I